MNNGIIKKFSVLTNTFADIFIRYTKSHNEKDENLIMIAGRQELLNN